MAYISNPAEPDRGRSLRHYLFPLTILLVCGGVFAFPIVWVALGHDSDEYVMIFWTMLLALPLGAILISAWYLFFGRAAWWVRLPVLLLGWALIPIAWTTCVRSYELKTNEFGMMPSIQFVWEPTRQQRLNDFQAQQSSKDGDLSAIDATVGPEDYASYRGPRRDGVVTRIRLQTDWNAHPPTLLWKHPCVEGYSGVAVAGNITVTLELREGREHIVCYDRATGRERWTYAYDANYEDKMNMGNGPRSTPTIHDGLIFTFGALGDLTCVDKEGKLQWAINLLKEAKATNITWGMTGSPLIVDDLVIAHAGVNPDAPANMALWAFDYKTGQKRWAVGNRKAGYSSPHFAVLDKVPQILLFDGAGLVSYDPKTGKHLWDIPWVSKMDMNMIQPVVIGPDRVFISSEATNGCALYQLIAPSQEARNWRIIPVWENKSLGARFANPVTDGTHIYGLQNITGILRCLNVSDGKVHWKGETRYGPGQMLLVDDTLLIVGDQGDVSLVKTNADEETVLARYQLFKDRTWNTPALAGDQLFVRNQTEIACLRLPRR